DADCATGLTCLTPEDGFPGGYCTKQTCLQDSCPGTFAVCAYLDAARTVTACVEGCDFDTDCRTDGYLCADLEGAKGCLPEQLATTGAGEIGSSCLGDGDCNQGLQCLTNFVFGYCSRACTGSAECGGEASCVDLDGDGSIRRCLDNCQNRNQCRFGYDCRSLNGSPGVCYVDDQTTGAVRNPSGQPDGEPCANDVDCMGGTCITGDEFPQGYCSTRSCDVVGCANENATCVNLQTESLCF